MQHVPVLRSLHQRLAALEALWDLQFTDRMGQTKTIRDHGKIYMCTLALRRDVRHSLDNQFFQIFKSPKGVTAQVWAKNSTANPLTTLFVREEMYYATTTMGAPRSVTVCLVEGNRGAGSETMYFAIKFRHITDREEVEGETISTLTQLELRNILACSANPELARLFPAFCFAVKILNTRDTGAAWEGIAMEPLVQIPLELFEPNQLYTKFAKMLTALHRAGHAHGDPHSMNFMFKKNGDNYNIRFVDADTLRAFPVPGWDYDAYKDVNIYGLPDDDPRRHGDLYKGILAAKVLVIQDFNKLLFAQNQFVDFTNRELTPEYKHNVGRFMRHKYRENRENKTCETRFCPWHYAESWESGPGGWVDKIYDAVSADQEYHLYLDKLTFADMNDYYLRLMAVANLKMFNAQMTKEFDHFLAAGP